MVGAVPSPCPVVAYLVVLASGAVRLLAGTLDCRHFRMGLLLDGIRLQVTFEDDVGCGEVFGIRAYCLY